MSDLQPTGTPLTLNGEERRLFWDLGVIELVQEAYGQHPFMAIESMIWTSEDGKIEYPQAKPVLDLLKILLDAEVDREKFFDGKSDKKTYTRKQLGHIVDRSNMGDVVMAIIHSWNEDTRSDDTDPEEAKKKT